MLTELTIKQLGVIEEATLAPGAGLTVVTGETGAGKTLVVQGLGLIAGGKTDAGIVRNHEGTARVEARFSDLAPQSCKDVEAAGGLIEDGELLVVRQILATGRSRSWIGGTGVTQAQAGQIGSDLVTIHGQSEQVRLSTSDRQRRVLDSAAGPQMAQALQSYRTSFEEHRELSAQLADATQSAAQRTQEADLLSFGLAEIERINPEEGEDLALKAEAHRLQDSDDMKALAFAAVAALAGDDESDEPSALTLLSNARKALEQAADHDPTATHLLDQAGEVLALTADLAGGVSGYLADLNDDPLRLEWVESRLAELKGLTRKYGEDATQVLAWATNARARLAEIDGVDDRIAKWSQRIAQLDDDLAAQAEAITKLREGAAASFGRRVAAELADLAMPSAQVEFRVTPLAERGPWGADSVGLFFTANSGAEPAPLGKVASGGELSRVRLAIEVVLADTSSGPTFVFDEVDAGIGGAVGLQVGLRLARLARQGQVIVVTHLAQVAAFAHTHYVVTKTDDGGVTASSLVAVDGEARLAELARMMGGLDQSASSLAHASELVEQARTMISLRDEF